jgi:hypothetical protein
VTCSCKEPREHANPRRKGWCARCQKQIRPEVLSTATTLEEFFDRLRWALFPKGEPSARFEHFRSLCEAREGQGRESFGLSYLTRENEQEAAEEASDLSMYMHLALLQARQRGEEEEWSTALEAAHHAFLAYDFAMQHQAKRRGTP